MERERTGKRGGGRERRGDVPKEEHQEGGALSVVLTRAQRPHLPGLLPFSTVG